MPGPPSTPASFRTTPRRLRRSHMFSPLALCAPPGMHGQAKVPSELTCLGGGERHRRDIHLGPADSRQSLLVRPHRLSRSSETGIGEGAPASMNLAGT